MVVFWGTMMGEKGEERGDILQITSSPPPTTPKSKVVRMLPTLLTFTTLTFLLHQTLTKRGPSCLSHSLPAFGLHCCPTMPAGRRPITVKTQN